MLITENKNGSLTISAFKDNHRVKRIYFGYSREQAKNKFKAYLQQLVIKH